MASANDLIQLLEAITLGGDDGKNLETLEELIRRISKTKAKQHIELDYNGREWFWKMPMANITASEWIIRERNHECVDS